MTRVPAEHGAVAPTSRQPRLDAKSSGFAQALANLERMAERGTARAPDLETARARTPAPTAADPASGPAKDAPQGRAPAIIRTPRDVQARTALTPPPAARPEAADAPARPATPITTKDAPPAASAAAPPQKPAAKAPAAPRLTPAATTRPAPDATPARPAETNADARKPDAAPETRRRTAPAASAAEPLPTLRTEAAPPPSPAATAVPFATAPTPREEIGPREPRPAPRRPAVARPAPIPEPAAETRTAAAKTAAPEARDVAPAPARAAPRTPPAPQIADAPAPAKSPAAKADATFTMLPEPVRLSQDLRHATRHEDRRPQGGATPQRGTDPADAPRVVRRETHFAPVNRPAITPAPAATAAPLVEDQAEPAPRASSLLDQFQRALEVAPKAGAMPDAKPLPQIQAPPQPLQASAQGPVRVVEIQLQPASMGTLSVTFRLTPFGMKVTVAANVRETAQRLQDDRAELTDMIRRAGYENVEVSIEESTAANDPGTGQGSGTFGQNADRRSREDTPAFPLEDPHGRSLHV
ncbi:flagellar hook-length control protein FliK [Acuticoccus kandeliae]|uniref:flagellar hook-length control protein FliK n=1 Tax=Acuticoccus kandeliae TaxID=2073160 RepID=UPI000D3E957F|nr:flagellar hook-length control protein FliK [Acuticoccus kandeliae]